MGIVEGQQWFEYLDPPAADYSGTDEAYDEHYAVALRGGRSGARARAQRAGIFWRGGGFAGEGRLLLLFQNAWSV